MHGEFDSALFEPMVIPPSQISVDPQWVSDTSGPIALMLAVLEEAARCIERGRQRRHLRTRKLAAEAAAWVRCDSREVVGRSLGLPGTHGQHGLGAIQSLNLGVVST